MAAAAGRFQVEEGGGGQGKGRKEGKIERTTWDVPWEGWAAWCNETRESRQSSKRNIIKQPPGSNITKMFPRTYLRSQTSKTTVLQCCRRTLVADILENAQSQ